MTITNNELVLSRLLALSSKIATVAANKPDQQQLDRLVKDARQVLGDIDTKGIAGDGRLSHLECSLTDVVFRIERLYGNGKSCSSPIMDMNNGYFDLDVFSACLKPGSLTVVAGATGIGKTAFAIQTAVHATSVSSCKQVAIFSMRESGREIAERFLSNVSMLDIHKLRSGQFDDNDWGRLSNGLRSECPYDVWMYNSGSIEINSLLTLCSEAGTLGLVIIDDLQCIYDINAKCNLDTDTILRSLKAMANELYVPIVVISNLFEPVVKRDDGPPRLADLENRDEISRTADTVLLIHRDETRMSASKRLSHAEVIVALHKDGPTGTVPFLFDRRTLCFRNRTTTFQLCDGKATYEQRAYESWISAFGGVSEMH